MDYLIHTKEAGLLLLIDFEQAFDSLNFTYIQEDLKSYNFGETYISWFNVIYNKAIRDGKYLAPPHASAWQRSPEHFDIFS